MRTRQNGLRAAAHALSWRILEPAPPSGAAHRGGEFVVAARNVSAAFPGEGLEVHLVCSGFIVVAEAS